MSEDVIPSEFRMISGSKDEQTSADVFNVGSFQLPDPAGRAGGACTSALLNILYSNHTKNEEELSCKDVLFRMRELLDEKGYSQIPQFSSSRIMNVDSKFDISHPDYPGTKRAVMIGINYVGQQGELAGCHNDVLNMKEYLMDVHDFKTKDIVVLMDDGVNTDPTYDNIMAAYKQVVEDSKPGDVVYLHYSGHGGYVRDYSGDEEDGHDETLIPLDFQTKGQIRDDDLLRKLVMPMRAGVFVTSVMDCCHSGTVLDLPYTFKADGVEVGMHQTEGFDASAAVSILDSIIAGEDEEEEGENTCCVVS